MKRLLSFALIACLMFGTAIPARAAEESEGNAVPGEPVEEIVTVSTLEELIDAIESSDNGDTIAVSATINLGGKVCHSDKDITLIRAEGFENAFFSIYQYGGTLSGLTMVNDLKQSGIVLVQTTSADAYAKIENCTFVGSGSFFSFMINVFSGNVEILNCNFRDNPHTVLNIGNESNVLVKDCVFSQIRHEWCGAIYNAGNLTLVNTEITHNQAATGGGVYNMGNITISNCRITDNLNLENKRDDIYSTGTLTIIDEPEDGSTFYDVDTGEKISFPLTDANGDIRLINLTPSQAAEYFAPAPNPDDNTDTPSEDDNTLDEGEEDPSEGDDTKDNTDDETKTPPAEEPQAPESGDNITNPDGEQSQSDDPSEEDNTDTSPGGETPSVTPQEPTESDDDDEDNHTPPASHRPVYRPTKPIVTIPEPEPAPALVCGDAVIDTSRSVILEGYGDGLLHLEDNLTRAQMATIIYRLLDAESIERYDNADSAFGDVASDAWYCRYVSTIARAGIVCGTGNGNYCPDAPLTWGHIITVLSRFVEAEDYELQNISYDGWALQPIKTAVALGWLEDSPAVDPDNLITRGEFMSFVNSVLETYR